MELQMSAERRKRAAILPLKAIANLPSTALEAKLRRKSSTPKLVKGYYSPSGGSTKTIILKPKQNASSKSSRLKPQLKRCKLLLKRSKLTPVLVKSSSYSPNTIWRWVQDWQQRQQHVHGPRSIPATLEGMRSIVSDVAQADSNPLFSTELPPLDTNHRV